MVLYPLEVDYDKLKYLINPTSTIKMIQQRIIADKATKEIKWNKKIVNTKENIERTDVVNKKKYNGMMTNLNPTISMSS